MGDYRELCKSLDIGLEKNDKFYAVLPELYSAIYLAQENRPRGMN